MICNFDVGISTFTFGSENYPVMQSRMDLTSLVIDLTLLTTCITTQHSIDNFLRVEITPSLE